jgi:hypothetical protein
MEIKYISLSAKLADKSLIGFDTSSWRRDGETQPAALETQNTKSGLGSKIGAKPVDKLAAKVGAKSGAKIGVKQGLKAVGVRARAGLKLRAI